MGDDTRKFEARLTTRYGIPEKDVYQQVLDLAKKNNLAKSRAQLLLVERGLTHTNNPEPLIKEVEKKVYVDRPVYIHNPDQANVKGQRASDDKLTNPNKAKSDPDSSKLVLEEKKSSNDGTSIGGWIALIVMFVGIPVTGYLIDRYVGK
ncbi:hypothetical protein ES705_48440 [subsurface metagenome]